MKNSYNYRVNYFIDNCLHTNKKFNKMVLKFSVAHVNICGKQLLIMLYLLNTPAVLTLCVFVVWRQKQPLIFLVLPLLSFYQTCTLFNELCENDMNLSNLSEECFNSILYGRSLFSDSQN